MILNISKDQKQTFILIYTKLLNYKCLSLSLYVTNEMHNANVSASEKLFSNKFALLTYFFAYGFDKTDDFEQKKLCLINTVY